MVLCITFNIASGLFSMGITTGVVSLAGTLDRETKSRYIVSIWVNLFIAIVTLIAVSLSIQSFFVIYLCPSFYFYFLCLSNLIFLHSTPDHS